MNLPTVPQLGVAIEGRRESLDETERRAALPRLNAYTRDTRFIDVFNTGATATEWTARTTSPWIKLSQASGNLREDARIVVSIDWDRAPRGENAEGTIEITGAGATRIVVVPIFNPTKAGWDRLTGFVESNGVVSIEAEHFTNKIDHAGIGWQVIPGLGRTGDSVAIFPTTAPSMDPERLVSESPVLEYRMHLFTAGRVTVTCYLVPTQPLHSGRGLRYAIGLDDQSPQVVTVGAEAEVTSLQWSRNVLNATTTGATTYAMTAAGAHILKIYMVDAGVVLDKIVLDAGGVRPSYLGPRETQVFTMTR
jgi:hypothetical protein